MLFWAAWPFQPLMYESVLSHGCNMHGLLSSHRFVVPVVMLSIVEQETHNKANAGLKRFLSASVSLAVMCSECVYCRMIHCTHIFWESIR